MQFVDSGWIRALELPAKITGGLSVACAVIWLLDGSDSLNLDDVASWLRPVILIIWISSSCLFGASLLGEAWTAGAAHLRKRAAAKDTAAKEAAELQKRNEQRQALVSQLDHLSERETHEAAKALKGGSPSFETWAYSPGAGHLIAKGLVYSLSGTYNQEQFPFIFHDFAWEALLERREVILANEAKFEKLRQRRR